MNSKDMNIYTTNDPHGKINRKISYFYDCNNLPNHAKLNK